MPPLEGRLKNARWYPPVVGAFEKTPSGIRGS